MASNTEIINTLINDAYEEIGQIAEAEYGDYFETLKVLALKSYSLGLKVGARKL